MSTQRKCCDQKRSKSDQAVARQSDFNHPGFPFLCRHKATTFNPARSIEDSDPDEQSDSDENDQEMNRTKKKSTSVRFLNSRKKKSYSILESKKTLDDDDESPSSSLSPPLRSNRSNPYDVKTSKETNTELSSKSFTIGITQKTGLYQGYWSEGFYHGYGCLRGPDGRVYNGEFKNGFKNGSGVETYPNGKKNMVGEIRVLEKYVDQF